MKLRYGSTVESFDQIRHAIAHEYFHVLQGQLNSGFAPLPNGEVAWEVGGAWWLVEGLATYAGDYAYTLSSSSPDRMAFFADIPEHFYVHIAWADLNDQSIEVGDLASLETGAYDSCSYLKPYNYGIGFLASLLLVQKFDQESYLKYWQLLGERVMWQQAFEEAFGISVADFYKAFQ